MKVSEYRQMMAYLTRPAFNGGGSVKNKTVLPKKKPEEEVKKRKIKNFEKAKPALENPKEVKEMIDKPKRGLVDEPGSYAGKEQYKNPKRAKARKKIFIDAYGQEAFDNLSRNAKSKVTAGDRDPLKVGTGQTGNPKTIYEPYRKEALKAFEKFKKSGKPFAALDIAEEAAKKMKGKKGAIKNINIEQLAQNLTRSFFTEEQKKFFDIQGSKIDRLKKIQKPKRIIFEKMIKGDSNIKSLMKATNLPKKEVENIIRNISNTDIPKAKKQLALGQDVQNVVLRDFKPEDFDTFRTSFASEPTLQITNKKAITELVTDAYRNQPKKLERALKRIKAYFKVANQLKEAGVKLNLDHPLARSIIGDIGKVEPEQLIRVNPLPQDINIGIKGQQFDRVYRDIINNLKVRNLPTADRKRLLIQKKALETLAKDLKIPFGKMAQTGKIIDFGTPRFLEKDLPKDIRSAINFKTRFKNALDRFEPQVLKERVMTAFGIDETKADNLINQFKTVAKEKNPKRVLNILKGIFKKDAGSIFKGLKADASGALDTISEAIFPTLQAAEVLPSEAQAASPRPKEPMSFDLDMSLPGKPPRRTPDELAMLAVPAAKSLKNVLGKAFTRLGTLGPIGAFAVADPMSAVYALPFLKTGSEQSGIFKKPKGRVQAITRFINRIPFLAPEASRAALGAISRGSIPGAIGMGIYDITKRSKPNMFIGPDGEPTFYDRDKADQVLPSMISEFERKYDLAKEKNIPFESVVTNMRDLKAGGGIMKMAGKSSGRPPESGPTPQGLDFLMKRGR